MIDTLFFALQIVGVVVLVGWSVINDRLKDGDAVRGPLAYKQAEGAAATSGGEQKGQSEAKARRRRPGLSKPRE